MAVFHILQKVNFEEGGGSTGVTYVSSQEWAQTVVNGKFVYLGVWGNTVDFFNSPESGPGLFFIGGSYDEAGTFSAKSYKNMEGLFCDIDGVPCSLQ